MTLNRRQLLTAAISLPAVACTSKFSLIESRDKRFDYILVAEKKPVRILADHPTMAMTFNGSAPGPVMRAKQGQRIRILFKNRLNEATTIHWHGIRIESAMDGVPFLTQKPIQPGDDFLYDFLCPDAGTFWYHPHVNSLKQLGMGLVGILIVDEETPLDFDLDIPLLLKDWHLNQDGSFKAFSTPRQAARMGTLGNVKTINGQSKPVFHVPTGGLIRARLVNADNTRTFNISLKEFPATVIAVDGNAVSEPFSLDVHAIGPGMRLDLAFIAPDKPGTTVAVYDRKGTFNFEMFQFKTIHSSASAATQYRPRTIPRLPLNPIPAPVLDKAETIHFVFEWEGALSPSDKDGNIDHQFWTINKRAWEGMSANNIPTPLANLKLGETYIFELYNATPHAHPIHLHGYTFTVIASNKRAINPYHTDTILLQKNERARIAFVADNPGRWMYHCHVIEHMKTGLMGYINVG